MPIIQSKKKSIRQGARRRVFNNRRKDTMKSIIKMIKGLVAEKKVEEAKELLPKAYKAIDKAAKRGVIKPNTAARKKSQVSKITKKDK